MFLKISAAFFAVLLIFSSGINAEEINTPNQNSVVGNWHGSLQTPQGNLSLILTFTQDDNNKLTAYLESPDQAPGQKIPVNDILIADGEISFSIKALGASYKGKWVEADQQWVGSFIQGMELPLSFKRGAPEAKPVIEGLDGIWEGTLNRNGASLRLILHINTGKSGTIVTLDSPDLGAYGLPVSSFGKNDTAVNFNVIAAAVNFNGLLSNNTKLSGEWTRQGQSGVEVSFIKKEEDKSIKKALNRPQYPKGPVDYSSEDIFVENQNAKGVTLAGTLTLPKGNGPFPVAILISGSGPQDRDESVFGHKPFLVLADHLTKHGIAVLRYDDRGFAASTGEFGIATSVDFASDTVALINYLNTRPEINKKAIGLIGHSEGGLIATLVAPSNKDIDFVVLLAAPGTSTIQLSNSQNRLMSISQGVSEDVINRNEKFNIKLMNAVAKSTSKKDAANKVTSLLNPETLELMGLNEAQKNNLIQQSSRNWYRYFLKFDPAKYLTDMTAPVLALNGSLDQQVPSHENLSGIKDALSQNSDVTIVELKGLNHMFQTAKTGSLGEYNDIEETFAPVALNIISNWIKDRFL